MNTNPFSYLSRLIDAALEAVTVSAAILLTVAVIIVATAEIRARWRRRGSPDATTKMLTATRRRSQTRRAEA